jgi:hypothetical protein
MTGRAKTGQMGQLGAGDEGKARGLWQAKQLFEPASGHLFNNGLGGSARMDGRVLIPNGCQPVGGKCRRERSSDDPSEKAATGVADDPAIGIPH